MAATGRVKVKHTNPNALNKLRRQYNDNYEVAVGYPQNTEATSTRYPNADISVIEVAAFNEFGTDRIEPRPFMALSRIPATKKVRPIIKAGVKKINRGETTKKQLAKLVAQSVPGVFKATITNLSTPENKQSTIDKKKSSNPLIDTGLMRNTLLAVARKSKKR